MSEAQMWQDLINYIGVDQYNIDTRLIASDDKSWTILVPTAQNARILEAFRPTYARFIRNHFQRFVSLHFVTPDDLQRDPALLRAALQRANHYQDQTDYCSLAELAETLEPIRWLWQDWIPLGMLSLLGASPGAGKSLVALDLARRIIHNLEFPDGTPTPTGDQTVIYVDAEAIPQIQNERAAAWEMDRSRLYLMLPPATYSMIDLTSEEHQNYLIDLAHRTNPALIIVDSLSSISIKGENNVEDVRSLLGFLSAVAREYEAGLLLIHHLRKRAQTPLIDLVTADDFRGSGHIIAMARSVIGLSIIQEGPQPDRNGPRRMEVVKTNLCRYPAALGLRLDKNLDDKRAPILTYTEAPRPYREPTKVDDCASWLLDLFADTDEPLKPGEVLTLAIKAGYTESTLRRARRALDGIIVDTENSRSPYNAWALSEDDNTE
jgi:hypothetical protein